MKRKYYFLIITIFSLFLVPNIVKADEFALIYECPETIKINSSFTCSIYEDVEGKVTEIKVDVSAPSGITLSSFTPSSGWTGSKSGNVITAKNVSSKDQDKVFIGKATFKTGTLKANYDYDVKANKTNSYVVVDDSYKVTHVNYLFSIRSANDDATLKSLDINEIGFDFNRTTYTYDLTTDKEMINVIAKTNDTNSTVKNTGAKNLNYGSNKIVITVTAENGKTQNYTLNVTRTDKRSSNNNLKSLTISSGNMEFNTNSSSYSITVDQSITMFNLEGYVEDETATFVTGFGPRTVNLVDGNNEILIKVKAENEDIKIYKINVYRKEKDESQTLTAIIVGNETIQVKEDVYQYKIVFDYNQKKVNIKTKYSGEQNVNVLGPENLEVGTNFYQIKVNDQETYTLEIVRNCLDCAILDTNNYLEDMSVEGHDFEFDRMSNTYKIPYKDESNLNITAMSENKDAHIQIINNNNLKPGSVVTILVTAEDGTTKEYKIEILDENANVNEESSSLALSTVIVTSIVTTIITNALIIGTIYLIYKIKKNRKKKSKKETKKED